MGTGTQFKVEEALVEDAGEYYCIASICEGGTILFDTLQRLTNQTTALTNRIAKH